MDFYKLSHPQRRIWVTESVYTDTSLHNIAGTAQLAGLVDFPLLEQCILEFIQGNEGLRLQMKTEKNESFPRQYISNRIPSHLNILDFRFFKDSEKKYEDWVRKEVNTPFHLEDKPLYHFMLVKISDHLQGFFFKLHHLIADGWSASSMFNEIWTLYESRLDGWEGTRTYPSYKMYVLRENDYLESRRYKRDERFWGKMFFNLSNANLEEATASLEAGRKRYVLDKNLSLRIKKFADSQGLSIHSFFTALMSVYRYKSTGFTDFILGSPVYNRLGKDEKKTFGMFTSTMPLRVNMDPAKTVKDFLNQLKRDLHTCYLHQRYPYDRLSSLLDLGKQGIPHLFQTCINFYNKKLKADIKGLPLTLREHHNGNQLYSLQLVIKDWPDEEALTMEIDYKKKVYSSSQIDELHHRLMRLSNQLISYPEKPLHDLDLLLENERSWLIHTLNQTNQTVPDEETIIQLFENEVKRNPHHMALISDKETITYKELNERANRLGHWLRKKGIRSNDYVAICGRHSVDLIVGIWGILKAGAAYLPVDPDYPAKRVQYMLEQSRARLFLLTNPLLLPSVDFQTCEVVDMKRLSMDGCSSENSRHYVTPEDLAYLMYTSGSTGKPKGVMISHRGLVHYSWWAKNRYIDHSDETFALYTSLSFDLTITSLFPPLINGNPVWIYDRTSDDFPLHNILADNCVNILKLTPAHLSLLRDCPLQDSSLRKLIVGGEDLQAGLARKVWEQFGGKVKIYNEYGPTETVVGCSIHEYDPQKDRVGSVPIGKPVNNMQLYILDEGMHPVPPGVVGEIYIAGTGVSRGYWDEPALTKKKFLPNPFSSDQMLYRSGDLGFRDPEGVLHFAGRKDHQLKVRGYRMESGEIEQLLLQHDVIRDARVLVKEVSGTPHLCAYVRSNDSGSFPETEIRMHLKQFLPDYMVPEWIIPLKEFPLTVNGKVDQKALPIPNMEYVSPSAENMIAGEKELEAVLSVFRKVFDTPSIRMDEHLFQMGGDSIKAIEIASALNQLGFKATAKLVLDHPTVCSLASVIHRSAPVNKQTDHPSGSLDITPIVQWFFNQSFPNPHHWNQSLLLKLTGDTDVDKLRDALTALVRFHDMLRVNVNLDQGRIFYNPKHHNKEVSLDRFDLSSLSFHEQSLRLQEYGQHMKSGFNIEKDLLFRAGLFDLGEKGKKLLLTAHHLLVDGVSWRILLDDLIRRYHAIEPFSDQGFEKTDSYQNWAHEILEQVKVRDKEIRGYCGKLESHLFTMPKQKNRRAYPYSHTIACTLNSTLTKRIFLEANKPYRTSAGDLLITAFGLVLREIFEQDTVVFELEKHGRDGVGDKIDVSRTVGWFTSMLPVMLQLKGENFGEVVRSVKEQLRQLPDGVLHQGIMRYLHGENRRKERKYVRFNYLGEFGSNDGNLSFALDYAETGDDVCPSNPMTSLMDFIAVKTGEELRISVWSDVWEPSFLSWFLTRYKFYIEGIVDWCIQSKPMFTPSDFDTVDLSSEDLEYLFGK